MLVSTLSRLSTSPSPRSTNSISCRREAEYVCSRRRATILCPECLSQSGSQVFKKPSRSEPDSLISIARPAFATAPRVKRSKRRPEACQIERSNGICYTRLQSQSIYQENMLTGLGEEKKSINLPMVKGILIDTAEEINNSPTAMSNGLLSGLARANILRKEDTFCGVLLKIDGGRNRASVVVFPGVRFCWDEDWVELNLQLICQILEDVRDGMIPKSAFAR